MHDTQQVFRLDDPASIRSTPRDPRPDGRNPSVPKDDLDVVGAAVKCARAAKRVPPGTSNHDTDTLQSSDEAIQIDPNINHRQQRLLLAHDACT